MIESYHFILFISRTDAIRPNTLKNPQLRAKQAHRKTAVLSISSKKSILVAKNLFKTSLKYPFALISVSSPLSIESFALSLNAIFVSTQPNNNQLYKEKLIPIQKLATFFRLSTTKTFTFSTIIKNGGRVLLSHLL